jgi:hypothetical protein
MKPPRKRQGLDESLLPETAIALVALANSQDALTDTQAAISQQQSPLAAPEHDAAQEEFVSVGTFSWQWCFFRGTR